MAARSENSSPGFPALVRSLAVAVALSELLVAQTPSTVRQTMPFQGRLALHAADPEVVPRLLLTSQALAQTAQNAKDVKGRNIHPNSDGQTVSTPSPPLRIGRIPIHGGADDEGVPYGLWAATDTYKVSFHGAPTFVPYLGKDAPRNLPVAWHTTSVRIGERELLRPGESPTRHRCTDYRFEYRYGAVTEAYEVLEQGLEQMFVLPTDPGVRGDIVVTGRLETPLSVAPIVAEHCPLDLGNGSARRVSPSRCARRRCPVTPCQPERSQAAALAQLPVWAMTDSNRRGSRRSRL